MVEAPAELGVIEVVKEGAVPRTGAPVPVGAANSRAELSEVDLRT
ncbi:MAG: hypothetical protein BWY00_01725 [Firmicutes bacterium ADurb.Bin153]|nr:MAG: hypothetical protein BWY00_01725 [Firmicutes bacterium ADurb.Bin153]